MGRVRKSFSVFDCDAHINDPLQIWDYVPASDRDLVRATYWRDERQARLNGTTRVGGGGSGEFWPAGMYNPICVGGPQMSKAILRRLIDMAPLTDEQLDYLEHKGACEPRARIRDLDLMGIDQVLVIPTKLLAHLPFADDPRGVDVLCRAYNAFVADWCSEEPSRLFPAAVLPLQSPELAVREIHRVVEPGFRVGLVRPIDARGQYPNDLGRPATAFGLGGLVSPNFDDVFRAFEETGLVLGMHTLTGHKPPRTAGPGLLASPGELINHAGGDSQTMSFVFEMLVWLAQVLLSGFLDRYPRLRMAVFESNSQWIPSMLESCDRYFRLYAKERQLPAKRLPSEAFYEQCVVSFESDEDPTLRQWEQFEDIGVWASDCYHHDAADAWSAIRAMRDVGVPEPVQAKLMGGNARRFYGIEPKLAVTEEPPPLERPGWFPQGPQFEAWAEEVAHRRRGGTAG